MSRLLMRTLAMAALIAPGTGCSEDDPSEPIVNDGVQTFDSVIAATGGFEDVVPRTDFEELDSEESTDASGVNWVCRTRRVSVVEAPDEYATFDPNSELVYPGSLLQGASLSSATPDPVVTNRAGGTVVIDLLNGSPSVSQDVDEVRHSTIIQAMNDILAENTGVVPARFSYNQYEVQSREQLALEMGVNVSTLTTDVDAQMSFSSDREYTRFLVTLNQSYYTMSLDLVPTPADLFAPGVTPQDLARYTGPGNPPALISSVTYGRRFYLLVESTSSSQEIYASIEASYNAAVTGGEMDASATYVRDLDEVRVKVFALGGDASEALATFNGDFGAVRDYLTAEIDIRTAVPLSYVVRDPGSNRIVNVKVATDYEVTECQPVEFGFDDPLFWFRADDTQLVVQAAGYGLRDYGYAEGTSNRTRHINDWPDASGRLGSAFPNQNSATKPFHWDNAVGSHATVEFFAYKVGNGPLKNNNLSFSGAVLENTDYTVFGVLSYPNQVQVYRGSFSNRVLNVPNAPGYFIGGPEAGEHRRVELGFPNTTQLGILHWPTQLRAPASPSNGFKVYAFRFSQTEGMSIYVNGVLLGSDAAAVTPVVGFSNAQIGCVGGEAANIGRRVRITELKGVGHAVSHDEILEETQRLRIKYGI